MPDDPRTVLARYGTPDEIRRLNEDAEDEEAMIAAWIAGAFRSPLDLWRTAEGLPTPADDRPLTVAQAAEREGVSTKTIRRRLPAMAAMVPPGAYKVGTTWRIVPVGLTALHERSEQSKPSPARAKRRRTPAKRETSTRWED